MSPRETRRTNHIDAALCALAIVAISILSVLRTDFNGTAVLVALVALGLRSTAVLVNAARLLAGGGSLAIDSEAEDATKP